MKPGKLLLFLALLVLFPAASCAAPFLPPPVSLQERDLVGAWQTHCGKRCAERIILRSDGTFQQSYRNLREEDYVAETSSNRWWLERLGDGQIRLHLDGGRYYREGIEFAKLGGREFPGPTELPNLWGIEGPPAVAFYDPIAHDYLEMVDELVLNVRTTRSGELQLLHMWTSSDRGYAILGANAEIFHRVVGSEDATEGFESS